MSWIKDGGPNDYIGATHACAGENCPGVEHKLKTVKCADCDEFSKDLAPGREHRVEVWIDFAKEVLIPMAQAFQDDIDKRTETLADCDEFSKDLADCISPERLNPRFGQDE